MEASTYRASHDDDDADDDKGEDFLYVSQIGEKLTRKVLQRFQRVINGYGTAETVHISTCRMFQSGCHSDDDDDDDNNNDSDDDDVRIVGRPQPFSTIYILNKRMSLLPLPHMTGDIYIGGSCLARGYLNLPQLTNEKYVNNPFGDGRIYFTGDVGRWTEDGELLLVGRKDSQIKINGYRIELGEIESVANQLNEVDKAIVMYRNNRLYLYWIGALIDIDTIKSHLYAHLPTAMIPNHFIHMSELPLNANGKVDKLSLPLQDKKDLSVDRQSVGDTNNDDASNCILVRMEASTEQEKQMLTIWKNVLRIDDLGVDDRFFEVGGDSLKLVLLLYQIQAAFDTYPLRVSDIYTHDTVSSLSTFLTYKSISSNSSSSSPPQHHSCFISSPTPPSSSSSSSSSTPVDSSSDQYTTCLVSYYQMHQLLWYGDIAIVKITIQQSNEVDLYDICSVIQNKFPILKTRLRRHDDTTSLDLHYLDVSDIYAVELMEIIERDGITIEDYDATVVVDQCSSRIHLNENEGLCRLFVSPTDNAIILIMSHLLFDGYSVDSLFTFIDQYIDTNSVDDDDDEDSSIAYDVEDYRAIHAYINRSVLQSYATDLDYWTQMLSQRVVGTRTIAMTLPFDSSKLKYHNPFQIIQLLNDTLPFPVLFHIDTSILRCSAMNYYSNGCLLCVDKGSTTNIIESTFKANLPHASIPIYLLINRFKLCNMVYINHAVMQYSGYKHIDVAFNMADDVRENFRGHYPLTVVYYGPEYCQIGIVHNFYYSHE